MLAKIKQSHWALVFAFASLFTLGLADNIRGTLFPEILNQFQISNTLGSWLFAASSSAAFVAGITATTFLRRYTISSLLFTGVLLLAVGLAVMGFSVNFSWLIAGSLFLGLGIGYMGVAQNLLVAENVDSKLRSRALSGLHGMYGLASFIAPLLAATTTEAFGKWSGAFYVVAIVSALFLAGQLLITPKPDFVVHKPAADLDDANKKRVSKKALAMVSFFFGFYVVAEILISSRLALYMRTYYTMDLMQSAEYVTLFFLFLLIGRVSFAFIHLPFSLKAQLNGFLIGTLIFLVMGLKLHPFFLALSGLTMAPYYPLCISYISEISQELSRTFLSVAMSFQSLAVVLMHLGVGYMTDQFGLAFAFGVGILALIISIICLSFHPQKLTV
ncbi:MAG: MFS transporter [Bdellovibrionota bacterium]